MFPVRNVTYVSGRSPLTPIQIAGRFAVLFDFPGFLILESTTRVLWNMVRPQPENSEGLGLTMPLSLLGHLTGDRIGRRLAGYGSWTEMLTASRFGLQFRILLRLVACLTWIVMLVVIAFLRPSTKV